MPRFTDEWVLNKILFECTTNSSCICCITTYSSFLPDGVNSLISSVSDLEPDVADLEQKSESLLTPEMKEAIWGDRVRVRFRMKKEISKYSTFLRDCLRNDFNILKEFCLGIGFHELNNLCQISKKSLTDTFCVKYDMNPIYHTVICAVSEQLANFNLTNYVLDSKSKEEENFERILKYNESCGFHLNFKTYIDEDGYVGVHQIDLKVLDIFVKVICHWLTGPKLLEKGSSSTVLKDIYDRKSIERHSKLGNRFRCDRRLIRLMIARYWADCIIEKYHESTVT